MTALKMLVSMLLLAGCGAALAASGSGEQSYANNIDRNDRDAGPKVRDMIVCATGYTTHEHNHPIVACNIAYEHAMAEKDYESAMYYVALGCGKYRNVGLCRHAARLPTVLGDLGARLPDSFRSELKRVAEKVCFSGLRITVASGADVTARECAYFARLFNLVKDPEYLISPEPAVTRILEALHDRAFAGKLYAAADFNRTINRDDHDAGLLAAKADPIALCELGLRSRTYLDPADACRAAFDIAMDGGALTAAASYASIGCNTYQVRVLCQYLAANRRDAQR